MIGVIWDLDGVVVDSAEFHRAAWQRLAAELGRAFTDDDFRRTFGMRNPEIIASVLRVEGPPERVAELGERKEALYRELARGRLRMLPGVERLLRELAERGVPQALATSTPRANVELILAELGLRDRFQALVTAEDVRKGKPDPEGFLLAAERLGVPAGWCVVLEDALVGAQAAAAAGMRCVLVAGERALGPLARDLPRGCRLARTLEEVNPESLVQLVAERA